MNRGQQYIVAGCLPLRIISTYSSESEAMREAESRASNEGGTFYVYEVRASVVARALVTRHDAAGDQS